MLRVGPNPVGSSGSHVYERVERSNRKRRVGRERKGAVNEIAGDEEVVNGSGSDCLG
jgi:hypothetical protein